MICRVGSGEEQDEVSVAKEKEGKRDREKETRQGGVEELQKILHLQAPPLLSFALDQPKSDSEVAQSRPRKI